MALTQRYRRLAPLALVGAVGIALAGCGAPGAPSGGGGDGGGGGDNTVTIYGTIVDAEAELLQQSWADWAEAEGITIKYEGSQDFETQLGTRAQGGNPPDIAIFPQPGLFADFASRDFLKPAPEEVEKNANEYWTKDWVNYGTVDGTFYGAPLMANVKGWIWYSPAKFAEWGVEIPKTLDELTTLTETIASTTGAPAWCAGFESGTATGWPGTDWIEDYVLRDSGAEVYDQWVTNEVKFTDPEIKGAFDKVGAILLNPAYVNAGFGDVRSINSTAFGDVAPALASGSCALTHQASFLAGFFPEGTNVAEDGDVWAFMLPGKTESDSAVTGGGEIVGGFSDDEATQKVLAYLSSPEWANSRVSLGGVTSANNGLDPESAKDPILQETIKILQDPDTTFRFDASDLMPGAVGAGTFWKGMVAWVNGTATDEVLTQIESGWPAG
ncbi:alpha-glucoside transport system substrate-binding protein [Microbacterium keratanolyticum]|uniref:Alpha-glucoside ABC transporter substrate-binding protein n=1 Tax=Microbacterium keratanolyticum TaxID=67574 RepID=A0A9W6HRR2_9MICO|nr:ABC transporter substrate-binding protein [Microbacterium keratanolyticum]MBM7469584.1 alpha-glucoside transport system substrate-binding protein [Microbacterium keratanolyticum]GLK01663.1 alpha-glucoside ABC transporter substrate-binding protein [Microbacterium keratanolyticum]